MKISDNELTMRGMNLLKAEFGPVDAERFVYVRPVTGLTTRSGKKIFSRAKQ